jgi:arginase
MGSPRPGRRQRRITLVGVPIDCVGAPRPGDAPFGTELAPAALRQAGLARAIGADDAGDLPVRLVGQARDAETGVVGWPSVRSVTSAVRARVRDVVTAGDLPFLAGGCCTLLPGALAGARDALAATGPTAAGPTPAGRTATGPAAIGLAYLDGHLDLYDGQTSPTGEPADMPISVVTGNGPAAWSADVGAPVADPARLALLGPRDRGEAVAGGSVMPENAGLEAELSPAALRARGLAEAGRAAARQVSGGAGRYWVHLDVDVLDEQIFPATDYPMPGGLTLDELYDLMAPLLAGPGLAGVSLGCYNPDKDPARSGAAALVSLLGAMLG